MTEAQWRQADIPPERVVWRNMQMRPSSAKPEINEKVCKIPKPLLYAVLHTSPTNMSDSSIIKMQLLMTNPIIRQISQFLNNSPHTNSL